MLTDDTRATFNRVDELVHEYRLAKAKMKATRLEMIRLAVDDLGLDQKEAQQNIEAFLEGYLRAFGPREGLGD